MLKKIALALLVILIIMQFFHPPRNAAPGEAPNQIARMYKVSPEIRGILKKACNDCHSNYTVYPWYSKVQPVDWWLSNHIMEGKNELNFDEFSAYPPRRQYRKLEEVMKQVKEGDMPLASYTWIHRDAILNASEKTSLLSWADSIRAELRSKYPIDSLERPKK